MYRKDLFQQAGLKMPEHPTWTQVADFAAQAQDRPTAPASACAVCPAGASSSRR